MRFIMLVCLSLLFSCSSMTKSPKDNKSQTYLRLLAKVDRTTDKHMSEMDRLSEDRPRQFKTFDKYVNRALLEFERTKFELLSEIIAEKEKLSTQEFNQLFSKIKAMAIGNSEKLYEQILTVKEYLSK